MSRVYLSPPDVTAADRQALIDAFDGGWIAPVGPDLTVFENALADQTGRAHAVALASGTAALHLALQEAGVRAGDRVAVQSLTFVATANAVTYAGGVPEFVDSEAATWNMDPNMLHRALDTGRQEGSPFKAVIAVDLYGQCADYERLGPICDEFGVALIEDAAEALGATRGGAPAGSFGDSSVLSFNGNKIITTSGGGAFLTDDPKAADHVRKLATQAREPFPHYEHTEIGYNYRLSNLLAALGVSQVADLDRRVRSRRNNNLHYRTALSAIPGITFMPEDARGECTFWLTAMTIDPDLAGFNREQLRLALEEQDIEARPLWKPMHLQPVFRDSPFYGTGTSDKLFDDGICLPSGSNLSEDDRERVISVVLGLAGRH